MQIMFGFMTAMLMKNAFFAPGKQQTLIL